MKEPIVYVLVGCPACGKSTFAKNFDNDTVVISSDAIREELYGDEAIQGNGKEVFSLYYDRAIAAIENGYDVILDATNVTRKARKNIFSTLGKSNIDCKFVAICFERELDVLLKQNAGRKRKVPKGVIERMYHNYVRPVEQEGFDKIVLM